MKKTITITISRQFGSNGREIGRKLAEYLDIGYYNKEIMEKIAKDMGVSSDFFNEDNQNEDGLYSISNRKLRSFGSIAELSVNSQVFERATDLICGIAQRESSVIVGRCADYALEDNENLLSVFIHADLDARIRRIARIYDLTDAKAKDMIMKTDKKRASYYNYYSNKKWGSAESYHMSLDSSVLGIDGTAEAIEKLVELKERDSNKKL